MFASGSGAITTSGSASTSNRSSALPSTSTPLRPGTHRARRAAPSFFLTSLFLMLNAANAVEAFRLRLRPRGVWRHDRVAVGPTIMRPDETFGFVRLEPADTLRQFAARGRAVIAAARASRGWRQQARGRRHRFSFGPAVAAIHRLHQRAARQGRFDSPHRVRPVRARGQADEDARVGRGAPCARRRARRRPVLRTFRRQSRPRLTPFSRYGVAYRPRVHKGAAYADGHENRRSRGCVHFLAMPSAVLSLAHATRLYDRVTCSALIFRFILVGT